MGTYRGTSNIAGVFEHLQSYFVTSNSTASYNCIAWAAGYSDRWWWPQGIQGYWPQEKVPEPHIAIFQNVFRTLGYETCSDGILEEGLEKVAIYAKGELVQHMARQLTNGWWTSKLGQAEDIEHKTAEELQGREYGSIVSYMSRIRS